MCNFFRSSVRLSSLLTLHENNKKTLKTKTILQTSQTPQITKHPKQNETKKKKKKKKTATKLLLLLLSYPRIQGVFGASSTPNPIRNFEMPVPSRHVQRVAIKAIHRIDFGSSFHQILHCSQMTLLHQPTKNQKKKKKKKKKKHAQRNTNLRSPMERSFFISDSVNVLDVDSLSRGRIVSKT
jgi:hypothetical protein